MQDLSCDSLLLFFTYLLATDSTARNTTLVLFRELERMFNMQGMKMPVSLRQMDVTLVFGDLWSTLVLKLAPYFLFITCYLPSILLPSNLSFGKARFAESVTLTGVARYFTFSCSLFSIYSTYEC